MNGKSILPAARSFGRTSLALVFGLAALAATGCVTYRAQIHVLPEGDLEVSEHAEMLPGVADSLHIEPRLAWTAFQATVESRGGKFTKDDLKSADGTYPMDSWAEFGQRGQAFKGIDEIERRGRPANAQFEVKDQYFYKDTSLAYKLELTEPSGVTVDSAAVGFLQAATGTFILDVPGTILKTNAKQRSGNTLTYPLAYGQSVDVDVTYRQWEWVAMVSVVLVFGFLAYLAMVGFKKFAQKGKKRTAA
jgi:hypothetical protein